MALRRFQPRGLLTLQEREARMSENLLVDRDSFELSFKTVNQADFQLRKSGKRAENKLEVSSIWL
jgi:hypothetical protein